MSVDPTVPFGVDDFRFDVEQPGDLVHEDIEHEVGRVLPVGGPSLDRAAVDNDAWRRRVAPAAGSGDQPGERHRVRQVHVLGVELLAVVGHFLHCELDAIELVCPSLLEMLDGVEDEVVELLRAGAADRDFGWGEPTAQAPAPPVAPSPCPAR